MDQRRIRLPREMASLGHLFLVLLLSVVQLDICGVGAHRFPAIDECLSDTNLVRPSARFELPSCIRRWHQHDLSHISKDLHTSVDYDMHFRYDKDSQSSFCKPGANSFAINNKMSQAWFPHFPHVSELFFYFVSTLLWQREVFQITSDYAANNNQSLCINAVSIVESNNIWKREGDDPTASNHSYIMQLFASVEDYFGVRTIQSKSCMTQQDKSITDSHNYNNEENNWPPNGWPPAWFLHASDAYMLGNIILGIEGEEKTCQYSSLALDNSTNKTPRPLHILVLNRRHNREIMNIDEVAKYLLELNINNNTNEIMSSRVDYLRANQTSTTNRILVTFFDGLSLYQQAELLRGTDVLITAHGAAETNLAFMKPCSVVMEVFPWAYHAKEYFGSLAAKVEVVYVEWQESYNNTIFVHDTLGDKSKLSKELLACKETFEAVLVKGHYDPAANYPSNYENDLVNEVCYKINSICRNCVQKVDLRGIRFSLPRLGATLKSALATRGKCLGAHIFYRLNDENGSYKHAYPFTNDQILHDGMVVKGGSRSVYLLSEGQRRPFGSGAAFMSRGYDFDQVVAIGEALLQKIPEGSTLS